MEKMSRYDLEHIARHDNDPRVRMAALGESIEIEDQYFVQKESGVFDDEYYESESETYYSGGFSISEKLKEAKEEPNPLFKSSKIDRAILSDDKILKDESGTKVGTLSKALLSDDQVIKDASGDKAGRITQSFWDKDKQIIKDSSGDKMGEIKTNFWGDRIIEDDKGDTVGTVRKNIWGKTVIKKD